MVCGRDKTCPTIFYVDSDGNRLKGDAFFALAVVTLWRVEFWLRRLVEITWIFRILPCLILLIE